MLEQSRDVFLIVSDPDRVHLLVDEFHNRHRPFGAQ